MANNVGIIFSQIYIYSKSLSGSVCLCARTRQLIYLSLSRSLSLDPPAQLVSSCHLSTNIAWWSFTHKRTHTDTQKHTQVRAEGEIQLGRGDEERKDESQKNSHTYL